MDGAGFGRYEKFYIYTSISINLCIGGYLLKKKRSNANVTAFSAEMMKEFVF